MIEMPKGSRPFHARAALHSRREINLIEMENALTNNIIMTVLVSLLVGYGIFLILLHLLPKKLRQENLTESHKIIEKANRRRDQIIQESQELTEEKLTLEKEEEEANFQDSMADLEVSKRQITATQRSYDQAQSRFKKRQNEQENIKVRVATTRDHAQKQKKTLSHLENDILLKLASIAECEINDLKKNATQLIINDFQLECQRASKEYLDEISTHAQKKALRVLDGILARYSPEFLWPKMTNHVDITSAKTLDLLQSEKFSLLKDLTELSEGVEINLWQEKKDQPYIIKLGGGYGIFKESARLTLENLLFAPPSNWHKVASIYSNHRKNLENQALQLGIEATKILQLSNIHPEIQKMIGALNWRTSYRQNQYYHSIEVAQLAGILANEMKVDPDTAKRCGILHDIGKGIDYRIEGSHAVISGDYADRFGESRLVCDTVMSHHNDLVLETVLSYILKTADTLSGARPGARVNLEEGYQIRLSAIDQVVKSFPGITKTAIMNGGREVHIEVHHKKVGETKLEGLARAIARKIEDDVAFPGQIKVIVSRRYEAVTVA